MRALLLAGLLTAGLAAPAHALGISVPSSASLGALSPGTTASSPAVSVTLSGIVLPWTLTVAPDTSDTPGRMRQSGGTCTGSATALGSPLRVATASTLHTATIDRPTYDLAAGGAQIAHGTATDVLSLIYSQLVTTGERVTTGCTYSVSLTFTLTG
jgi:hypothetical protein